MWKLLPGEKILPISPSALIGEFFIAQFFCPVLMITLRIWRPLPHWRKFIPPNIFAIQRQLGLAKFCLAKILLYTVCTQALHYHVAHQHNLITVHAVVTCTFGTLIPMHSESHIPHYCNAMVIYAEQHIQDTSISEPGFTFKTDSSLILATASVSLQIHTLYYVPCC